MFPLAASQSQSLVGPHPHFTARQMFFSPNSVSFVLQTHLCSLQPEFCWNLLVPHDFLEARLDVFSNFWCWILWFWPVLSILPEVLHDNFLGLPDLIVTSTCFCHFLLWAGDLKPIFYLLRSFWPLRASVILRMLGPHCLEGPMAAGCRDMIRGSLVFFLVNKPWPWGA